MKLVTLIVASCFVAMAIGFTSTSAAQSNNCPPGQTKQGNYCQKKSPGQYCNDQKVSKKKIPGQKQTPFAQCVTAMAKINKKQSTAPSQACASLKQISGKKNQNKKNKGAANAAFKSCVQAGKKLKLDLANA